MTRQGRRVRACKVVTGMLLAVGVGLLSSAFWPTRLAAALSPTELVDKATLRIDLGAHHTAITATAASADGRWLATGGLDRVVRLWDSQTGELVRTLYPPSQDIGPEGRIGALAFSPDGRHLAVGGSLHHWDAAEGRGSGVYLFDISSGQLVRRLPGVPSSPEYEQGSRLLFSPDGQRLLLISGKGTMLRLGAVRVYDQPTGAKPRPSDVPQSMFVDADFAPDGRVFLAHTTGLTVYADHQMVRDSGKYTPLNVLAGKTTQTALSTHSVRVSPDGKRIAISYQERGRIEIRDSRSIKLLATLELAPKGDLLPSSLDWAADGKSVLYAGNRPRMAQGERGGVLLRVLLGKTLRAETLWQPPAEITSTAQLPDGGILCGGADASFTLLAADGKVRLQQRPNALLASDPTELYTNEDGTRVWLRYGPQPKDSYGFSLSQLAADSRLQLGKPVDDSLHPPRIEVPAPYNLYGWRQQKMVTLNAAALPLRGEEPYALAIAPDQRSFVIGTSDGLRRFAFDRRASASDCPTAPRQGSDLPSPCFETALPARALAINYSGDGNVIVAALSDGSIRWFGAQNGQLLLSFVLHSDKRRWVLFQPHGRYAASIAGAALVGWQVNPAQVRAATLFPLERFAAKLYDPAGVAATLPSVSSANQGDSPEELPLGHSDGRVPAEPVRKPKPLILDPAKPKDLALRGMLPPVATILSPSDGATVKDGQVTLRVMVHSPVRQAIRGVRVLVNGRLDPKARGVIDMDSDPAGAGAGAGAGLGAGAGAGAGDVGGQGSGVEVYSLPVAIPVGRNSIAVYAEGSAGASVPAVIHVSSSAVATTTPASRPRLLVLAVGVGAYPRPDLQLTYPAKDASDLVRVLKEQGSRLYGEVVERVITDEKASLSGIRAGFSWLTENLRPDDTALIFLAGHGVNEAGSGQYVFLPRDVDLTRVAQTGLSGAELQRVLSGLPSRALLFLDTCHSGNVLSVRRGRGVPSPADDATGQAGDVTRFVGDLASVEQGIVVMAASTGRQASQESPQWQNGAFTLALIEGLRGNADFRKTGRVTVNMLDLYVSERVRELTDGAQTPATAKPVTIPDFPVVTLR